MKNIDIECSCKQPVQPVQPVPSDTPPVSPWWLNDSPIVDPVADSVADSPVVDRVADPVQTIHEDKTELVEPLSRLKCTPHNDPDNYIDEPAPNRHGWTRTTCKVCRCFIGYRSVTL